MIRESRHTESVAGEKINTARVTEHELQTAAADVNNQHFLSPSLDAGFGAHKNQTALLFPTDNAYTQLGLPVNGLQKFAAILGFADGAGGYRDGLPDVAFLGYFVKTLDDIERALHSSCGQAPLLKTAVTETCCILFMIK